MPIFATLGELAKLGVTALNEDRQVLAKAAKTTIQGSTFLSHSSRDDRAQVAGVVSILERHGASVYLDKKDPELPPQTNRETAEILKVRIQQCNRFILFATPRSSASRWVPWELGVSDGYKGPGRVAVFPGVENTTNVTWANEEYLGAYDRIAFGMLEGHTKELWMVWNMGENVARPLADWIAD